MPVTKVYSAMDYSSCAADAASCDAAGVRLPLDGAALWRERRTPALCAKGCPALFLDRDGVVVEEVHYLARPEDVCLAAGAADLIAAANAAGVAVVLVTNQSGIARGYFDWHGFQAVQDQMHADLAAAGAYIDAVYACGHHKKGVAPYNNGGHSWRKPGAGMLLAAAADLGIDLSRSVLIGDKDSDIRAGIAAGVQALVHVHTGHGSEDHEIAAVAAAQDAFPMCNIESAIDLPAAMDWVKARLNIA